MKRSYHLTCLVAGALALPTMAFASLGGTMDSVQADQVHMKATARIASTNAKYTVHEMETATGTKVREYIATNGTVFGVAWNGPTVPDLRQVLGTYFDTFSKATKVSQSGHSHMLIQQSDLVVRSSGRMRAFKGNAFAPALLPQGVTSSDIL